VIEKLTEEPHEGAGGQWIIGARQRRDTTVRRERWVVLNSKLLLARRRVAKRGQRRRVGVCDPVTDIAGFAVDKINAAHGVTRRRHYRRELCVQKALGVAPDGCRKTRKDLIGAAPGWVENVITYASDVSETGGIRWENGRIIREVDLVPPKIEIRQGKLHFGCSLS